MTSALIGHTGFVGGNLARQHKFDEFYNSKNIEKIRGRKFDLVVCAGMPGAKWYANAHPQEDYIALVRLRSALQNITAKKVVIISTVDAIEPHDTYGTHRKALEECREATILRLPALFGPGLKKNALYDLMHDQHLSDIAPNDTYQWYPIDCLWRDVQVIVDNPIKEVDFGSQPISMEEIRVEFFPDSKIGKKKDKPIMYDARPCLFWNNKSYIFDKMAKFLRDEKCGKFIPTPLPASIGKMAI
jgi:hypothetical protein